MSKYHPAYITGWRSSELLDDPQLARWIEGYAAACADLMGDLTGDSPGSKSYDPLTVDPGSGKLHSYAFDMKDGGRHHPIADYATIGEIAACLRGEAVQWIKDDAADVLTATHRDGAA